MRPENTNEAIDAYQTACAELEAATKEYYQASERYRLARETASVAHRDMDALLKKTRSLPSLPEPLPMEDDKRAPINPPY